MKKIIVITLLSLLTFSAYSQKVSEDINEGEMFKDGSFITNVVFSESDGNGGTVFLRTYHLHRREYNDAYYVEHYDHNLRLVKREKLERDYDKDTFKGMIVSNGTIQLIEFNKLESQKYELNLLSAPIETMSFKRRNLVTINSEEFKEYYKHDKFVMFFPGSSYDENALGEIFFSENKNFLVFTMDVNDADKVIHKFFLFDKTLTKIDEYEFRRDFRDELFEFQNVTVNDVDGSIYLLGKVFENDLREIEIEKSVNYHYELFRISSVGEQKLSLDTRGKYVKTLKQISNGNMLSYVGFFGERNEKKYDGVCRYDIGLDGFELKTISFNTFSKQLYKDKYGKESVKELENLVINDRSLYLEDNGDLTIVAEENYKKIKGEVWLDHFDDVICIKIDINGNLLWSRNINKDQIRTRRYLSYSSMMKDGKIYIFFNGAEKISEKDGYVDFKGPKVKKGHLYAVSLDEMGNFKFAKVYGNPSTPGLVIQPQKGAVDSKGNITFLGSVKNSTMKQMIQIKYEVFEGLIK